MSGVVETTRNDAAGRPPMLISNFATPAEPEQGVVVVC
jgi:hypothetical protein